MKILITGNMGYVGPMVLRRLREFHPAAQLVGYDMGYFAHCLTGVERFPESFTDVQYFGDIRSVNDEVLRGVDAVVHLCAISNDPMGALFEDITLDINHRASIDLANKAKRVGVRSLYSHRVAASMALRKVAHDGKKTRSIPSPRMPNRRSIQNEISHCWLLRPSPQRASDLQRLAE